MRRFVWTEKGKMIHVTALYGSMTLCGRVPVGGADAGDVLWFEVCKKCSAACRVEDSYTMGTPLGQVGVVTTAGAQSSNADIDAEASESDGS